MYSILDFAKDRNADETYAKILEGYHRETGLVILAKRYEEATLDDDQFCFMVEALLTLNQEHCN
tara:strand:- start:218 stop:409 length:192 start_codon:yes stop_codon:yes gene_type:complete